MSDPIMTPEWILFGVRAQAGEVWVYASTELGPVELRAVTKADLREPISPFQRDAIRYIEWKGQMRRYVVVAGATYADAVRHLFERWSPDDQGPAPLAWPMRELRP